MSLKQFYEDRYYQIRSFGWNALAVWAACALLYSLRDASFYTFEFSAWHLLLIPLGVYVGGLSCVWIHNATHQSFPTPWLNELCGYLAGAQQLWGYRGWKLIHLIHHQYSDVEESDPHPTKGRQFLPYMRAMFVRSSLTVSKRYREHWKDSPQTALLQKTGLVLFVLMALGFLTLWFLLLGPVGFVFFYPPSIVWNHYMFAHINYYCHPLDPATNETAATNLNHALYYKLANFFWHGIYFHGNHHKKPTLFNPRKMSVGSKRDEISMQGQG